jgi:hypothetical protein
LNDRPRKAGRMYFSFYMRSGKGILGRFRSIEILGGIQSFQNSELALVRESMLFNENPW